MNYHILRLKVEKIFININFHLEKNSILEAEIGKNGPGILGVNEFTTYLSKILLDPTS
jgi:hypothetical protein